MAGAFVIVVVAVGIVGVLGALVTLLSSRGAWEELGRDHLQLDSDARAAPAPRTSSSPAARAERDGEIRQMLDARNARRRRRGEPELDVEAELRRLVAGAAPAPVRPGADDELTVEIRQLVIARNHRRARRGEPPLDVEAEVAREIARLSE